MQNQKITIEVIETKEFHVAARGYNQHEVDEFLDSICDELERIEEEMDALKAENDRLKNQAVPQVASQAVPQVRPYAAPVQGGSSDTFQEILEMAQRVKEQTIADAEAKAAEILANAETQVKARLGNLTEEKDALEANVESLKDAVQSFKAQFAQMLSAAKDALDTIGDM